MIVVLLVAGYAVVAVITALVRLLTRVAPKALSPSGG